jgi:signal transduction histidine kinase
MMRRLREVRAAVRRHPRRVDAALALLLAAFVLQETFTSDVVASPVLVIGALAVTLPLAWRRSAPLLTTAVVMAAYPIQLLFDDSPQEPQTPLLAMLLGVYSVGAHEEHRRAVAGLLISWVSILAIEPGDFVVLGPVFAGTWFAGRLVRAREDDAHRLRELSHALERERVEEARIAAAEERARIARELHDVVAHSMSTIVLEAGAERVNLPEGQRSTDEALRSIERTGREALAEMRRLVGVLRSDDDAPALAPQPSLVHLDELAARVRRAGLPVELETNGKPVELPPGIDISAYRIVQEALTNVLKHAGEASARVRVTYGPRSLAIDVSDDGRGGSPSDGGHGLTGLRERVTVFGGEFEAGGREEGGFFVHAELPIEQASR